MSLGLEAPELSLDCGLELGARSFLLLGRESPPLFASLLGFLVDNISPGLLAKPLLDSLCLVVFSAKLRKSFDDCLGLFVSGGPPSVVSPSICAAYSPCIAMSAPVKGFPSF